MIRRHWVALVACLAIFTVLTGVGYRMTGTSIAPLLAVPIVVGAVVGLVARMLIGRDTAV